MDILHWKQKDLSGREFILSALEKPFGKLDFKGWSSYDAVYTAGSNSISFTSNGWFEQHVIICLTMRRLEQPILLFSIKHNCVYLTVKSMI